MDTGQREELEQQRRAQTQRQSRRQSTDKAERALGRWSLPRPGSRSLWRRNITRATNAARGSGGPAHAEWRVTPEWAEQARRLRKAAGGRLVVSVVDGAETLLGVTMRVMDDAPNALMFNGGAGPWRVYVDWM